MSKRLISISNDSSLYYNEHAWFARINEVLKKGNARVVTILPGKANDPWHGAVAFIEIEDIKKAE